ncbi:MAG TPA: MMPL family transporter [Noviherbaspirillum sp.]
MTWWHRAACLWIAMALAASAFVVARFYQGSPVQSDILALLPPTERNPDAEAAVQALTRRLGNRALFLVAHEDAGLSKELARDFAARLRTSKAFVQVIDAVPKVDARIVNDTYQPYRASLLTPADRDALANNTFDPDTSLLRRMHQPFRMGIATDLTEDPFGFFQHWLSSLPLANSRLTTEDGMLVSRDGKAVYVLVLAEPAGSAFDAATQSRAIPAVAAAEAALKSHAPGATLLRTGAIFYAEAARSSAQSEVDLIGGGSLAGILILLWALFRSIRPLALGMITVAIGIICGMAAVLAVHGQIHIITVVFGASLIGEAIDYAIQYFAARLGAGPEWEPRKGLRRILPGLIIALATSLIGYAALSLTPFPAISQIALFAFAGLAAAWLSVVLLLPLFVRRPDKRDVEQTVRLPQRILRYWRERVTPGTALLLCVAVVAFSVPGWMKLAADDDVRQLVSRPPHLVEQEASIRRLAAGDASGRFFLVEGADDEEALQREEVLTTRLRRHIGNGIAGYSAISDFVPSLATQRHHRVLLSRALPADKVAALLERHGFREESATAWARALDDRQSLLTLAQWRNTALAMPVKHQILKTGTTGTALLVTLNGDDGSRALAAVASGLPGITLVDKAASVSALFARYRHLAALWLPAAAAIILTVLAGRYGLRQGVAILLPTLLAMAAALAVYGYTGVPLTLFSMMGLVLVLGVGVNYAIFLVEAGDRAPAPFAGVLLSAATTILSFGLLSLSGMPALHQFGLVLLVGISFSVLLAPLALTLGKKYA